MWDELENYKPISACSCTIPCLYATIKSIQKYYEQDYVIRFLKGLDEKFAHSKCQIMMMNPQSDVDKAFSLVIQQEQGMNNAVSMVVPNIPEG